MREGEREGISLLQLVKSGERISPFAVPTLLQGRLIRYMLKHREEVGCRLPGPYKAGPKV
jgi:hypothetical protein